MDAALERHRAGFADLLAVRRAGFDEVVLPVT
jgi:hypothetical protein